VLLFQIEALAFMKGLLHCQISVTAQIAWRADREEVLNVEKHCQRAVQSCKVARISTMIFGKNGGQAFSVDISVGNSRPLDS